MPNQRNKAFTALEKDIYVTIKANHNLSTSQKEIIWLNFILGHIGFQHVKWLIFTRRLKVQENYKSVTIKVLSAIPMCLERLIYIMIK